MKLVYRACSSLDSLRKRPHYLKQRPHVVMDISSLLKTTFEGVECKALESSLGYVVLNTDDCLVKKGDFRLFCEEF